jgi:hypothetical protein
MSYPFETDIVYTQPELARRLGAAGDIQIFPRDEGGADTYLIIDTPEREYWFRPADGGWLYSHTWSHFFLGTLHDIPPAPKVSSVQGPARIGRILHAEPVYPDLSRLRLFKLRRVVYIPGKEDHEYQ